MTHKCDTDMSVALQYFAGGDKKVMNEISVFARVGLASPMGKVKLYLIKRSSKVGVSFQLSCVYSEPYRMATFMYPLPMVH